MDWAYLFNSFHGRIGRQSFWIGVAVLTVAQFVAYIVAEAIQGDRLSAIVDLAFTYPELAIAVKRAHDRNLPLWLLIILFVSNGVIDLLGLLGWTGTPEEPSSPVMFAFVVFFILLIALLVELGFRRGTPGPNQYGPDPLANRS
jgi:uncharacterized membrane protein YhaH (DUF805 family)